MVGQSGTILKTSDGGTNWFPQSGLTTSNLTSLCFINVQTGWVVGRNGTIRKTIDGGSNWIIQNSGTTGWLESVFFADSLRGWVIARHILSGTSTILKTINGGRTWTSNFDNTFTRLYDIFFINDRTGWVVGTGGAIFKTTDAGITWTPQLSGTSWWLECVHFVNETTGWTVGTLGIILKTTTGGVVTAVKYLSDTQPTVPKEIVLLQNYPNPFNPSTTIRFILGKSTFVTLKIYDLLGKEIETLVHGYKSSGGHQVRWTTNGLSSGIYFYRLQADNSVETKKLTLLH